MKNTLHLVGVAALAVCAWTSGSAIAQDKAPEKAQLCTACHGDRGISQVPDFPKLAGQYKTYLVRALNDYKSGSRKNVIMAAQVTSLTPQDIDELAEYYSRQQALATKY